MYFCFVFAFEEMLNAVDAITLNNKIYFCLNSNEDIDTNQLPQQLMKGELEGYERCFFSVYLAFKSYSCYLKQGVYRDYDSGLTRILLKSKTKFDKRKSLLFQEGVLNKVSV